MSPTHIHTEALAPVNEEHQEDYSPLGECIDTATLIVEGGTQMKVAEAIYCNAHI